MPRGKQNLKIKIKWQQCCEEIYFLLMMIWECFSWREQRRGLGQQELAVNLGRSVAEELAEGRVCVWYGGRGE